MFEAKEFRSEVPWACISVSQEHHPWTEIDSKNRQGLLQLQFYDTDTLSSGRFLPRQAKQILEFVQEHVHQIDVLMIHCQMGHSRSPAIAAAISKLMTGDDNLYFKKYTPNMLVYSTILKVAHKLNVSFQPND
jgi:predicted protein tyrosine phosphatase